MITADAALVAAVLRRANAADRGSSIAITSLEAAVGRIGVEELLRLALAQSVGVTAGHAGPLAALRRDVWRQALQAARIALELSERRQIDPDEAFVAGLLHDFGAIAVLVGLEDLKIELPLLPAATWKVLIDRLHVRFGGVIAHRWNLPAPIEHAIAYHHDVARYRGPHRALVELIATVDHINAIFDRAPTTTVGALLEVPGLTQDERYRIGAMMPQLAAFMASFETAASPAAEARAPSAVAPSTALDDGWPVELPVTTRRDEYHACALGPSGFAFRGTAAMVPGWLAELTLGAEPPLDMLANVRSCEPQPDGSYLIVAQPFALDGNDKQLWFELVQRTREAAR